MQQSLYKWRDNLKNATDPQRKNWLEREIEKAENQMEAVHENIRILDGKMRSQVVTICEALKGLFVEDKSLGE